MATEMERFHKKYVVNTETTCFDWTGAVNSGGRAMFSIKGKAVLAHRFIFEKLVSKLKDNEDVRRDCNNSLCVNFLHLSTYTHDDSDRLWSNVAVTDNHWYWGGPRLFKANGKTSSPRRAIYTDYMNEDPPSTLKVICGDVECVNPLHCGNITDSFWAKVDKHSDGHWYWSGPVLKSGYAHISFNGTNQYVHRIAWDLSGLNKPIKNEVIYHKCRIKLCVNPAHLAALTHSEIGEIKRLVNELP